MKDYQNLTPQAARFVKGEIELALRHHFNGDVEGVFNVLSRLQLNCTRALHAADPQNEMQALSPNPQP